MKKIYTVELEVTVSADSEDEAVDAATSPLRCSRGIVDFGVTCSYAHEEEQGEDE